MTLAMSSVIRRYLKHAGAFVAYTGGFEDGINWGANTNAGWDPLCALRGPKRTGREVQRRL